MVLLSLLKQDGFVLNYKASTNGGEYNGPCPWCGGNYRFLVWPAEGQTGRYWCRECHKSGDGIQYLREKHGMNFYQACQALNVTPKFKKRPQILGWQPKDFIYPSPAWQTKAKGFVEWAQANLWDKSCTGIRQWLMHKRGLSEPTIRAGCLGWCPTTYSLDRQDWGLHETGKKLWIFAGLVIPYKVNSRVIRIRIRKRYCPKGTRRYYVMPGSSMTPMILGNQDPMLIIESDLDARLVYQEAGNIVTVMSLGSANIRPDKRAHQRLWKTNKILLSLDNDDTGIQQSNLWWKKQYPNKLNYYPPINGKDPGEMFQNGMSIRKWVKTGLSIITK